MGVAPCTRINLLKLFDPEAFCNVCGRDSIPDSPSFTPNTEPVHESQYCMLKSTKNKNPDGFPRPSWKCSVPVGNEDFVEAPLTSIGQIKPQEYYATVGYALTQIHLSDCLSEAYYSLVKRDWYELTDLLPLAKHTRGLGEGLLHSPLSARLIVAYLVYYRELKGLCFSCIGRIFLEEVEMYLGANYELSTILTHPTPVKWSHYEDAAPAFAATLPDMIFYTQSLVKHCSLISVFYGQCDLSPLSEGISCTGPFVMKAIRTDVFPAFEFLSFDSAKHLGPEALPENLHYYKQLFAVCYLAHTDNYGVRCLLNDTRITHLVPNWEVSVAGAHTHIEKRYIDYLIAASTSDKKAAFKLLKTSIQLYYYSHLNQVYLLGEGRESDIHPVTLDWLRLWDGVYGGECFKRSVFPGLVLNNVGEYRAYNEHAEDWPDFENEAELMADDSASTPPHGYPSPEPAEQGEVIYYAHDIIPTLNNFVLRIENIDLSPRDLATIIQASGWNYTEE
jgi:hypothetical protein